MRRKAPPLPANELTVNIVHDDLFFLPFPNSSSLRLPRWCLQLWCMVFHEARVSTLEQEQCLPVPSAEPENRELQGELTNIMNNRDLVS